MALTLRVEGVDRRSGEVRQVTIVYADLVSDRVIYRYVFVKDGKKPRVLFANQYDDFGNYITSRPNLPRDLYARIFKRASAILFENQVRNRKEVSHVQSTPSSGGTGAAGGVGASHVQLNLFT